MDRSLERELEAERAARLRAESLLNDRTAELTGYRELVESVSDIIYRADENGCFIYVNPTATSITGFSEEELIGTHFTRLIRKDFREKLALFYMNQLKQHIRTTYMEFPIVRKNREEIWVGQTVDLHRKENETQFIALCRDISDRRKAESALARSEEKYRNIIESLELGLIDINTNGYIVKAYPQFCELTGYTSEELEGKMATEILIDEKSHPTIAIQSEKHKKGLASVFEMEIFRKNGTPMWTIISTAPYYNEENEVTGTLAVHLDITGRKKMEEELIHARDIAEQSLRSKDLFVANMSHELRTPMNAIIGMSRLLSDSGLTEKQHEYVNAIRTSSDNLLTIVNDLLDFSKLEAGKMALELIPGDLKRTILSVAQLLELKIDEKGLILEEHIDPKLSEQYVFDPTRLNGVLTNLLHNAMKFTSEGKLSLTVRVEQQLDSADVITFEVEDTGIGIPREKIAGIFDSFVQAESSTTRNYGGTGLGLSISKELVHLMGGELKVHSKPGKGSCFYFTLQLDRSQETITGTETAYDENVIAGLRVLLVEDNQINRFMAQTILEQWKAKVTSAENGAVAVDLLHHNIFDLILMDMQMPVLDGLQATWMIRNKLKLETPIIALTANAVKGESDKCLEAGMNGFVSKPFRQEELLQAIVLVLGKSPAAITETALAPPAAGSLVDLTMLYKNTNNDEQFMHRMLQLMIAETDRKIVQIEALLAEKDAVRIAQIVHSMKPSVDHVAAESIRELLREVETSKDPYPVFSAKANELTDLQKALVRALKQHPLVDRTS